jgi:hypothetical protein
LRNSISLCHPCEGGGIRTPLPIVPEFALYGRRFRLEIENPAGNETAQNRNVGNDDGDVVFDVVDAIVDWVCPVGLEEAV